MSARQPSLGDWEQKLAADLKGRGADRLRWQTADGFAVDALASRQDLSDLPHLSAVPLLRQRRGWQIRELITAATPTEAADRARSAVSAGADEVEFSLDELAQDALEPSLPEPDTMGDDDPMGEEEDPLGSWSAPGEGGVAVHSRSDFDAMLGELDVGAHPVWFSAGEGAIPLLAWHLRRADARGVARDRLRGGFDIDPIARLTMRQVQMPDDIRLASQRTSIDSVFAETADVLRSCREACPGIRPVVIDGLTHHLTGTAPGFELGATLAAGVEMARHLRDFGVDFETLSHGCSVRVQVGHELLLEVAKLRALRLCFARIASEFGAPATSFAPYVLGITSSRQRAEAFDQRTNLLRTQIASFAAVLGGCDSLVTQPLDDGADSTDQARLARNQQLLLRHEAHLQRVADPCGGSFAIERLTDRIARRAFEVLQEIEAQGGLLEAMQCGWFGDRTAEQERAREQSFRVRRKVLVGISRYADLELGGPNPDDSDAATGEAVEAQRSEAAVAHIVNHLSRIEQRDAASAQQYLAGLRNPSGDYLAQLTHAGADALSLAEIATARWPGEEAVFEHRFLPLASVDAAEYEELRMWAQLHEESGAPQPRVALLPLGPVRMARARADFARDLFAVGGLAVDDPGRLDDVAAAIAHVRDSGARVAVLCSDDDSYSRLIDELVEPIRETGAQIVLAGKVADELAARVDGCIHVGMDCVAYLEELQGSLGVQNDDEATDIDS